MIEMGRTSRDHMLAPGEIQEVREAGHQGSDEAGHQGSGEVSPSPRAASPDNRRTLHPTRTTLVVYYMMTVVAGLLIGVDTYIVGGVLATRPFMRQFLYKKWIEQSLARETTVCFYVNVPIQLLNVTYFIAALLFFIAAATLYARIGGHKLLFVGAMLHIIGHGFHFGPVLGTLITGRIFIGAGVGVITLAVEGLIFNINQSNHRNILETIYACAIVVGPPTAYVINTVGDIHYPITAWKIAFMSTFPLSFLLFFCSWFYCFYGIRGSNDTEVPLWNSFVLLFNEENRKKTIISLAQELMLPMTDFGLFLTWSPVILLAYDIPDDLALKIILVLTIIQSTSTFFSVFILRLVGRRCLLLPCGILMIIVQVIIGLLIVTTGDTKHAFSHLKMVCLLIYIGIFLILNGGLATISGWLGNPLPDSCKLGSLFCTKCIYFIMHILVVWVSLPLFCKLGGFMFFFLAFIVLIIVVFLYYFV